MVEVERLIPLVRFPDYVPYWLEWLVIKLLRTLIREWVRKLRVDKWRILDRKLESGLMTD
jgi:hypothetical protein